MRSAVGDQERVVLEVLRDEIAGPEDPGEVRPGTGEAFDQTVPNGIGRVEEDDRVSCDSTVAFCAARID